MLRIGDVARLPGTRIAQRCAVCSTGVDTIDTLAGGGLPLPSVYVISECNSRRFAPLLQRYFVAEGLCESHDVLVSRPSDDGDDDEYLEQLPAPATPAPPSSSTTAAPSNMRGSRGDDDADFKIAWRYKTMPAVNSALSVKDKTKYDLTKSLKFDRNSIAMCHETSYEALWQRICTLLSAERFAASRGGRVARILITDVGSPLYSDPHALCAFLCRLRALLQSANAIVMLSVDDTLYTSDERDTLAAVADAYFRLDVPSASTRDAHALEDRYDGRFYVEKLPLLNSISTHKPECVDLVFERRPRYLDIRILHLPAVMGGAVAEASKPSCQRALDQF